MAEYFRHLSVAKRIAISFVFVLLFVGVGGSVALLKMDALRVQLGDIINNYNITGVPTFNRINSIGY